MELLKLSKFKLQLQALVTEARDLRERENSASEQCHLLIQKQKQMEEEHSRKLQELQAELSSSNEWRRKLERNVSYLQNDHALLEEKLKELKGTIQNLLQSRDSFVNAYQESTSEMKRMIEHKDRKIGVLSEKISSHLSLFDSIEKEALLIKGVVDNVQRIVTEKDEIVAGLRRKMDRISAFESVFVAKIRDLEHKLKSNEDEFLRKDRIISELEAQLQAAEISDSRQAQIEELRKTLLAKDVVIQNLISDKEALHCELGNLVIIFKKIQETVTNMNEKDKSLFVSVLKCQEDCDLAMTSENNRIEDMAQNSRETSPNRSSTMGPAENQASSQGHGQNSVGNLPHETIHFNSCVSEIACTPQHSPCSELQSADNGPSISASNRQVKCTATVQPLDSECSTTQAQTSEGHA